MLTKEITNEREYRMAHAEADKLASALAVQDRDTAHLSPPVRQMMHDATAARLEELRSRLTAYETLRASGGAVVTLEDLEQLPHILIRARTAANMTQRALAARLGVSEQQVQRDEKNGYAGVSLGRLAAVARALGLGLHIEAILPSAVLVEADARSTDGSGSESVGSLPGETSADPRTGVSPRAPGA
jgi:HTH-type transcriptional regulator/antitoxin HigA